MKKRLKILIISMVVLFFALPSWATSTRVQCVDPDYDVQDITLDAQDEDHWYSAGLDVVYVNGMRHFLVLWNSNSNWPNLSVPDGNYITLSLYDYNGNLVKDIATYTDPLNTDGDPDNDVVMWPQSVKLDPDGSTIWISYTGADETGWPENLSDYFCTLPWDHTLLIYAGGPLSMTSQFEFLGNWEMEWSTDPDSSPDSLRGKRFVSGLETINPANNGIFLYTPGGGLVLVIDTGGNSAGFAFDNMGNLWYASYDFSTTNQIYMWTAGQIRDAVKNSYTLVTADAARTISTPHHLGGNDVERDAVGNMYFSLNNGDWPYAKGQVVRVDNNGSPPWPTTTTTLTETLADYDWKRTLAFDGLGDLSIHGVQEASNRLYVDMDQGIQGGTIPTVVGISAAGDADADGVPDALDNCWQTANADQADTDACGYGQNGWYGADAYGNVCDSAPNVYNDYDGDGIADIRDWSWDTPDDQIISVTELNGVIGSWFQAPPRPDMDHDADGIVSVFELNFVIANWFQPQPLHPWWP